MEELVSGQQSITQALGKVVTKLDNLTVKVDKMDFGDPKGNGMR